MSNKNLNSIDIRNLPDAKPEYFSVASLVLSAVSFPALMLRCWGPWGLAIGGAVLAAKIATTDKIISIQSPKASPSPTFNDLPEGIIEKLANKAGIPVPKIVHQTPSIFPQDATASAYKDHIDVAPQVFEWIEPDEKIGILAHEICHIKHKDFSRSQFSFNATLISRLSCYPAFGAAVFGKLDFPTVGALCIASVINGCIQNYLNQKEEHRRDEEATEMLPHNSGLINFFQEEADYRMQSKIFLNKRHFLYQKLLTTVICGLAEALVPANPDPAKRADVIQRHHKKIFGRELYVTPLHEKNAVTASENYTL